MLCVKSTSLIRAQLRFICNSRILDISRELRIHLAILLHSNVHCTCGHRLERFLGPQTLSFACNSIFSINRTFNLYNTEVCSTLAQVLRQQRERERERVDGFSMWEREAVATCKNPTRISLWSLSSLSQVKERERKTLVGEKFFQFLRKSTQFFASSMKGGWKFFFLFCDNKTMSLSEGNRDFHAGS